MTKFSPFFLFNIISFVVKLILKKYNAMENQNNPTGDNSVINGSENQNKVMPSGIFDHFNVNDDDNKEVNNDKTKESSLTKEDNLNNDAGKKVEDESKKTEESEEQKESENNGEEGSVENQEDSVIKYVQNKLGYDVTDEHGNPITYEDTEEGLAKYTSDVVEIVKQQTREEASKEVIEGLINEFPELPDLLRHYKLHGSIKNYTSTVDYSTVNIDPNNSVMQEQIIYSDLISKNIGDEDAKTMIQLWKDKGQLLDKAKQSLDVLKSKQLSEIENLNKQQAIERQREEESINKYFKTVEEKISVGSVKGYTIPESQKEKFYKYLAEDTGNGLSQSMIDNQNLDVDTTLFLNYLIYNKFDLSKLVKEAIGQERAKTLTEKIKSQKAIGQTQSSKNVKNDFSELSKYSPEEYMSSYVQEAVKAKQNKTK